MIRFPSWLSRADLIVVGAVTLLTVGGSVAAAVGQPSVRPLWPAGVLLLSAACVALWWRERRTVLCLTLTAGMVAVYYLAEFPAGPAALPLLTAIFFAGRAGRLAEAVTAAVAAAATAMAAIVLDLHSAPGPVDMVAYAAVPALAAALGQLNRARLDRLAADRRRAVDGERLRIAQELHDLLAHQLSLINVLSAAALHGRDPEQAFAALAQVKEASRDTLRELRMVLGTLRQVDEGRTGAPGLDRLDDLVSRTISAGLPVRVDIAGAPCVLPAAVDLAAYRIIQESLTNTLRHAEAAQAIVALSYGDEQLEVRVHDDGKGTPGQRRVEGHGLAGMRERALGVGGTLTAQNGRRGFEVRAVLPLTGRG